MDYSWVQYPLLLRSVLYVPGDNARALAKAPTLPADALILDLEDAVLPERKAEARENIRNLLKEAEFGYRKVVVRVNHPDEDDFPRDIAALEGLPVNGIVLPKTETRESIQKAEQYLEQHGLSLPLWIMIETPKGLLNATELAADESVEALVAGTQDLARAFRLPRQHAREALRPYLAQIVAAARAYDAMVFDGIYQDYQDLAGFEVECSEGRKLGFDGKTLIHPSTLEPANRLFTPDAQEVVEARRIVEATAAAKKEGKAITIIDGRMIEPLHAELAKEIVEKAEMAEAREAELAHGEA